MLWCWNFQSDSIIHPTSTNLNMPPIVLNNTLPSYTEPSTSSAAVFPGLHIFYKFIWRTSLTRFLQYSTKLTLVAAIIKYTKNNSQQPAAKVKTLPFGYQCGYLWCRNRLHRKSIHSNISSHTGLQGWLVAWINLVGRAPKRIDFWTSMPCRPETTAQLSAIVACKKTIKLRVVWICIFDACPYIGYDCAAANIFLHGGIW